MRALVWTLVVSLLSIAASAQASKGPSSNIRIRRLTIESTTLPDADRQQIVGQLQGKTYPADATLAHFSSEMGERVRGWLQVLGYFKASVDEPRAALVSEQRNLRVVDLTVAVDEGWHYYLGEIRFKNGTLFPAEEMRSAIPIQAGELFNVEKMREGIRNLRNLYHGRGYVNFTPVPDTETDDSRHIVDVNFHLDEGRQFMFGPLVLDGPEPHVGAGRALLESWKSLRGEPYNPDLLQQWLAENRLDLPVNAERHIETSQDNTLGIIIVRLWFP